MTVTTPSYKINGMLLTPQPSQAAWGDRQMLGIDGNSNAIYGPTYTFEMQWDALTPSEFNSLFSIWQTYVATQASATADLPDKTGLLPFNTFVTYTGVVIDEPVPGQMSQGFVTNVRLRIRKVTV